MTPGGNWGSQVGREASTESGVGDDEDGLGVDGGRKGLAVDQPWNIDEVDETTRDSSLVQDQPSGRQISLPPRGLAVVAAIGYVAK